MASTPDKLPSGSWGFGPVLIQWDLQADNEVLVDVSVLGIQVDELTGTLNGEKLNIDDKIDLLGIVKGEIGLEAKYGQPNGNGLYVDLELTAPGFDIGPVSYCIIPW
jgi:hypothetical protein